MIAIKDMPMPRNCYECWFEDANRCYLYFLQRLESLDRPEWCPLVEIAEPEHGRWNTVVHSNNHITYYCPKCGSIFNKGCADLGEYNYCPNCGSKMDLDEVEE